MVRLTFQKRLLAVASWHAQQYTHSTGLLGELGMQVQEMQVNVRCNRTHVAHVPYRVYAFF